MVKVIEQQEYQKLWKQNKLSFLQSWQWGETRAAVSKVERLTINEKYPVTVFYKKFPLINKEFAYIPKLWSEDITADALNELVRYLSKKNLSHLIIEPNLLSDSVNQALYSDAGFTSEKSYIQPKHSNIIDLSVSEEELFSGLKSKTRNEVRMSEKKGVIIKSFSEGEDAFNRFHEVLKYIIAHTDYQMPGRQYFLRVWQQLSSAKLAKIFIATDQEGRDLGAYFMAYDERGAYHLYGGINGIGREYEAGYALKWSTIKDAKAMGLELYDHWGTAPSKDGEYDKSDPLYHIAKFKAGFGGREVQFSDQQILIFNYFVYSLYQVSIKLQKLLIKFKNLMK